MTSCMCFIIVHLKYMYQFTIHVHNLLSTVIMKHECQHSQLCAFVEYVLSNSHSDFLFLRIKPF